MRTTKLQSKSSINLLWVEFQNAFSTKRNLAQRGSTTWKSLQPQVKHLVPKEPSYATTNGRHAQTPIIAFVKRSDRYVPLAAIREATLDDYFRFTPNLVMECELIDISAFQEDMSRYLKLTKLASKTMIKPITSAPKMTRTPREATPYNSQQREPTTSKFQHRGSPNPRYQNTVKHQYYICDGKPHPEPHTSTICPCTITSLASGQFRHQNGRLCSKNGTVLRYADRPVNVTYRDQLIHGDSYLAVANKQPVARSNKLEIKGPQLNVLQIKLIPRIEDIPTSHSTNPTASVCSLHVVDHKVQIRSKLRKRMREEQELGLPDLPMADLSDLSQRTKARIRPKSGEPLTRPIRAEIVEATKND